MSGINHEIVLDSRHIAKHLPDTPQVERLLRRGRSAHVFNDEATMERVAQAIIESGEFTGVIRRYERYGLFFAEPIGYRISPDSGSRTPLFKQGDTISFSCTMQLHDQSIFRYQRL
jgi:hypothetical protein